MRAEHLMNLNIRLRSLAIFRDLLDDPVISALGAFLASVDIEPTAETVSKYAEFVSRLYETGSSSLAKYVQSVVGDNENAYIRLIGEGKQPCIEMEGCVGQELTVLQAVADLTPETLRSGLYWSGFLPAFPVGKVNIADTYKTRCENIGQYGYGIYARYRMFYINPAGQIVPVRNPDKIRLSSLVDYKREQKIILDNTLALLEGKPAANILLTGDAGTGKSSTVKAIVNELYPQGLRILEVRKEQLHEIPGILDTLNSNPLKFILFIDDLSFQKDDDNFSALKAILEGSVSAKSSNVVIYATSNRRHLVRQTFSDRAGDEVDASETIQEKTSLAERFGLRIPYLALNKADFLDLVERMAAQSGITMDKQALRTGADRWEMRHPGRTPRTAKQYIASLSLT